MKHTGPAMTARWPKTVLLAITRWDYGDAARGPSCEDAFFSEPLRALTSRVETVWIDEWLDRPKAGAHAISQAVERFHPDLVFFVPARSEIDPDLLTGLRGRTSTLAWFGDDQWRFDGFTRFRAPLFDHVVTTAHTRLRDYRQLGVEPILSQWAAAWTDDLLGPARESEMRYDVSFVGGASPSRRWFVRQLGKQGVAVRCWGAGWPAGRLSFSEVADVFRTSRVNLNLSNSVTRDLRYVLSGPRAARDYLLSTKRTEQPKARHFEIALGGGFQLTNYFVGLERYFRVGEEIALYTSPEDCAVQVDHYLSTPEERRAIASRGFERARMEHTFHHRLRAVLTAIWGPPP